MSNYTYTRAVTESFTVSRTAAGSMAGKIGKITYLSSQNSIAAGSEAKSVRLDILVKDEAGKTYDIEMQVANEHNIPKRMRYYQAALDISFLDKGLHYKTLNDSYIIRAEGLIPRRLRRNKGY